MPTPSKAATGSIPMAMPVCFMPHGETMKRFGDSSEDLFGNESFDDMSAGEFFLMCHTLPYDCIERANWAMLNVPEFEGNRLLDSEDQVLLDDGLKAYIFGLYAGVILS